MLKDVLQALREKLDTTRGELDFSMHDKSKLIHENAILHDDNEKLSGIQQEHQGQ